MPKCKNDSNASYKGDEPSPKGFGWCAHGEVLGKRRKGTDGNMWQVGEDKNGRLRWVKVRVLTIYLTKQDIFAKI
jgi:hypothetical protein